MENCTELGGGKLYTVEPEDYSYLISSTCGIEVDELVALNPWMEDRGEKET
jgi:hypothetical protein